MRRVETNDELPLHDVIVRPPVSIHDLLREALLILEEVPGFVAAAISRLDGLVIYHTFDIGSDASRLCAMAAAMTGASGSTGSELRLGEFDHVTIRYAEGSLVVKEAGPRAIVATVFEPGANLGLLLLRLGDVAAKVSEVLEEFS